jgi:hypothetical protein
MARNFITVFISADLLQNKKREKKRNKKLSREVMSLACALSETVRAAAVLIETFRDITQSFHDNLRKRPRSLPFQPLISLNAAYTISS